MATAVMSAVIIACAPVAPRIPIIVIAMPPLDSGILTTIVMISAIKVTPVMTGIGK
jgi:hypothetical protein